MHQNQLTRYHDTLVALRDRLTEQVRKTSDRVADKGAAPDELSHVPTHPADGDSEGLERDVELERNREQMIEAIDDALERIQDGGYGRCMDCGTDIPQARLEVLPFALRCVDCERKRQGDTGG